MDPKSIERLAYLAFGQAFFIASAFQDDGDQFMLALMGIGWTIAAVFGARRKARER